MLMGSTDNHNISIALATYNGAKYLREQLDSLYGQSIVPAEVVVCDDQSTDATVDILEEYHQRYGLTYYVNTKHLGYNLNFYQAISLCTGEYIALSDQDDVWMSDKLAKSLNAIQQMGDVPCMVTSQAIDMDGQGRVLSEQHKIMSYKRSIDTMLYDGINQGCTIMMNRWLADQVLKHTELHHLYYYDVVISILALSWGCKISLSDRTMYYRHHSDNVVGVLHRPKLSFRERVTTRPTYHHLCADSRLEALNAIYHSISEDIKDEEINRIFLCSEQLRTAPTLLYGLKRLYYMPGLTIKEWTDICIYSMANGLLRKLINNKII